MTLTHLCIVARPMSRPTDRMRFATGGSGLGVALLALFVLIAGTGCEQLDGRNRVRKGNRSFKETKFIDAAAEYEKALTEVNDPLIHFNLGLAYSKVFKPGYTKPIRLGVQGTFVCNSIPNTKTEAARVCVKGDDRRFDDCDEKNVCPSSYQCLQSNLCVLDSAQIADLAATHFQVWIKAQPSDDEIKKQLKEAQADLEEAKASDNKSRQSEAEKRVDELQAKDEIRKQMTQVWMDSEQFPKALAYWTGLLNDKPNDPEIMGNLAGINLKANEWRTSIDWYLKVADVTTDPAAKVAAYQFIGNVAWSKLNSKSLTTEETIELADRGIGALQKAAAIQPKNPKLVGLQASLYNFRGLAHGASWASAIDRASAQDLQRYSRVLAEEAKKAQGGAAPAPPTPPMSGGPAEKAGG